MRRIIAARKAVSLTIQKEISDYIEKLGMEKSIFRISIAHREEETGIIEIDQKRYFANERGMDVIDFLISPGKEENMKPISKIASGGELSRIMLAIKSVMAEIDHIPILIFDEIDSGISGRIASAVGKELKELGRYHQVLCITHLPQIAGRADQHYSIEKKEREDRIVTEVRNLSADERKKEIAHLISGEKVTEESILTAEKLIDEGKDNGKV